MTAVPTIGVEEEFLLLDPATGGPVPAAPRVLRRTEHLSPPRAELMQYQIEAATGVCAGLWWRRRRGSLRPSAGPLFPGCSGAPATGQGRTSPFRGGAARRTAHRPRTGEGGRSTIIC